MANCLKRKCVFGVLCTEEGLRIKNEMSAWLNDKYDVFVVEAEPPNTLYEFPFIKKL